MDELLEEETKTVGSRLILVCGVADPSRIDRGGHIAHDRYADYVKRFSEAASLPYDNVFVSLMCGDAEVPKLPAAYGRPALLRNETVVPDTVLVSHEDIQTVAYNGWKKRKVKSYAKRITDLSGLSFEERVEVILQAARNASSGGYAEARLFRPLVAADIVRWL